MMKKHFRLLLIVSILAPLTMSGLFSQNVRIQKWAMGSGGMVAAQNSSGMKMSGMIGQLAIEKISNGDSGEIIDVYQGYWVPKANQGVDVPEPTPPEARLSNYPNPFSSSTTVQYFLPGYAYVTLTVYDVSGNKVKELFSGYQNSGEQQAAWDGKDFTGTDAASGSYLYELVVKPAQMAGDSFRAYNLRNVMVLVR